MLSQAGGVRELRLARAQGAEQGARLESVEAVGPSRGTWLKAREPSCWGRVGAGSLAPYEAPDVPGLRSGLCMGAQFLQEGQGWAMGRCPIEVLRHF